MIAASQASIRARVGLISRPVIQDPDPDPLGQRRQGDGDPDLGLPTIPAGGGRVVQLAAADLDEGVVAAGTGTALILRTLGALRQRWDSASNAAMMSAPPAVS